MKLETADPALWNEDLAPVGQDHRTWDWKSIAALWVGMVVCIPTYTLAGGLITSGLSAWQAVGVVLLGNLIVLVPMILTGHAGVKYGLPFPVLLRSAFGPKGAQLPALARGLVACGWFSTLYAAGIFQWRLFRVQTLQGSQGSAAEAYPGLRQCGTMGRGRGQAQSLFAFCAHDRDQGHHPEESPQPLQSSEKVPAGFSV